LIVQLDASYRACCEDRDAARQELDKLRISLRALEDFKSQSEQQISSLSAQVSFIFCCCCRWCFWINSRFLIHQITLVFFKFSENRCSEKGNSGCPYVSITNRGWILMNLSTNLLIAVLFWK